MTITKATFIKATTRSQKYRKRSRRDSIRTFSGGRRISLSSRIPRPFVTSWTVDYAFLALLAALQTAVLPILLPEYLSLDVMTPWVAVIYVIKRVPGSLIHGAIAAILIETHSSTPTGMYVVAYWVLGTVATLIRENLSWNNKTSWAALIIVSQTWIFCCEFFVSFIEFGGSPAGIEYYLTQGFRIAFSGVFGIFLLRNLEQNHIQHTRCATSTSANKMQNRQIPKNNHVRPPTGSPIKTKGIASTMSGMQTPSKPSANWKGA